MTKEQFNATAFKKGDRVNYKGENYDIRGVDFRDAEIAISIVDYRDWEWLKCESLEHIPISGWVSVDNALPKDSQTVFITNGTGCTAIGCLITNKDGCYWALSNGIVYEEEGEIVSECESDDLDVKFWHKLPKPLKSS